MNFFLPCLCCHLIPKSTETDYYIDPNIMTSGEPFFEPTRVQHKISVQEFLEMRQAMRSAGGEDLKLAKMLFIIMRIYTIICFEVFVGILVLGLGFPERFGGLLIPVLVNIAGFILPNLCFYCCWRSCARKAYKNICEVFELNEKIYLAKGVKWSINKNLMYVQIKTETNEFSEGKITNRSFQESDTGRNTVLEMITVISNQEILLKS